MKANTFAEIDGVWGMIIIHKGDTYFVKVDKDDIPLLSKYRWYIGRRKKNLYCIGNMGNNNKEYLHRFLIPNSKQVDHKNGDTLDNRKENLRPCDNSLNSMNKPKQKNNTTGYKNISVDRKWYRVQIVFGDRKYDKRFLKLEDAIVARDNIYSEWQIPCERELDSNE